MTYVLLACLSILVGTGLGFVIAKKREREFAAGFALLGLAAGLLVGLSNSPVVASGITAGFALVGSLLPLYLSAKTPSQERDGAAGPFTPPVGNWLVPLACMAIVGILGGMSIRVNELLFIPNPVPNRNLRTDYAAMGFSDAQVDRIMEGHAAFLAKGEPRDPPKPPRPTTPAALLNATEKTQVIQVLADAEGISDPDERLAFVVKQAPVLKDEVTRLRAEKRQSDEILDLIRKDVQK